MADELAQLHMKVDQIATDVVIIKTKLNFTYQYILPMIVGAISLIAGVFAGVAMAH